MAVMILTWVGTIVLCFLGIFVCCLMGAATYLVIRDMSK